MRLAGFDVTSSVTWSHTRRLSRPCSVTLTMQAEMAYFQIGKSSLQLYKDGDIKFNGVVWNAEMQGDETDATVAVTAYDPLIYWPMRYVQDDDGDWSDPDLIETAATSTQIMASALDNTIAKDGDMGLQRGTVNSSSFTVTAFPADWPMTMDDMRKLLVSTGKLDVVIVPLDSVSSPYARADFYPGNYGTDLSESVTLAWGTDPYNAKAVRRTTDMSNVCNKLWYLLGPKCTFDSQHWRGNITRDDPCLPGNSGLIVGPPPRVCDPAPGSGVGGVAGTPLGDRIDDSRSDYFVMMDIDVYDDLGGECNNINNNDEGAPKATGTNAYRRMYERIWQAESWMRAVPRNLVSLDPIDDYDVTFDVGDLIRVKAGTRLAGGFNGIQRVYEYTQEMDVNGTVSTTVVTSADNE